MNDETEGPSSGITWSARGIGEGSQGDSEATQKGTGEAGEGSGSSAVGGSSRHGMSKTPEYQAWLNMRCRCYNEKDKKYKYYGGRGIIVCQEWLGCFMAFFSYVGFRPSPEYSIDRIDPSGNYEPGNVRWATREVQAANKRERAPRAKIQPPNRFLGGIPIELFEESGRKGGLASSKASPEERSRRAHKAWETKRKKAKERSDGNN